MKIDSNYLIDEIITIEARGMFADLTMSTELLYEF